MSGSKASIVLLTKVQEEIQALVANQPATKQADKARWAIEGVLMEALKSDGIRAVRAALKGLSADGELFQLVEKESGSYRWQAKISQDRVIELAVNFAGGVQGTSVTYRIDRPLALTPRQQRLADAHAAFYSHYERIAASVHATGGKKRLGRAEKIILFVGELEAEINNGGFSQYLLNKGRSRAKQALEALIAVEAKRTATLLEQALQPETVEEVLDRLDAKYYRQAEDLPSLVVKHLLLALHPLSAERGPCSSS